MEVSGIGGRQGVYMLIFSYIHMHIKKKKKQEGNNYASVVILQKAARDRAGSNKCFCFPSVPSAISVLKRMEAAITW